MRDKARRMALGGLLPILLSALPAHAQPSDPVLGRWWTPDHDGVVDIQRCRSGLCGRVIGITEMLPDGRMPVDNHGRSRCNLQIISDGTQERDGTWDSHITNPDDGKTYTITLRTDAGRLRMRGYIGIPLFGRTVYWQRFNGRTTPDCRVE